MPSSDSVYPILQACSRDQAIHLMGPRPRRRVRQKNSVFGERREVNDRDAPAAILTDSHGAVGEIVGLAAVWGVTIARAHARAYLRVTMPDGNVLVD